ncbi:MAG: ABC transporter permease subunit [Bdellovibrionaceae bacterium]|nr:ABC transporter permease subunit [Pseudobdellovibrionaceae bacterium]
MLEKWIKNEQSLKRLRRFFASKRSVFGLALVALMMFISVTAEFWVNNKPIALIYKGSVYFPVVKTYHPSTFNQNKAFVMDYRKLQKQNPDTKMIWPLIKWNPFETDKALKGYPASPSSSHWMGSDDRGRDVLARLVYGLRYSLGFALLVWVTSYIVGVFLGALMGFFGSWVDLIGQRFVEIIESLPGLFLLIIMVSIFGASFPLLVGFFVFFGWMGISIYMRAEFLKLRNREFVESSRAMGGGTFRLMFTHILPNALVPIITFSPFVIAGSIAGLATLDYLGFGLPAPTPSWGELLRQGKEQFTVAWWLAIYPSLAMFISIMAFNFIGEGVRDAFDSKKVI